MKTKLFISFDQEGRSFCSFIFNYKVFANFMDDGADKKTSSFEMIVLAESIIIKKSIKVVLETIHTSTDVDDVLSETRKSILLSDKSA